MECLTWCIQDMWFIWSRPGTWRMCWWFLSLGRSLSARVREGRILMTKCAWRCFQLWSVWIMWCCQKGILWMILWSAWSRMSMWRGKSIPEPEKTLPGRLKKKRPWWKNMEAGLALLRVKYLALQSLLIQLCLVCRMRSGVIWRILRPGIRWRKFGIMQIKPVSRRCWWSEMWSLTNIPTVMFREWWVRIWDIRPDYLIQKSIWEALWLLQGICPALQRTWLWCPLSEKRRRCGFACLMSWRIVFSWK